MATHSETVSLPRARRAVASQCPAGSAKPQSPGNPSATAAACISGMQEPVGGLGGGGLCLSLHTSPVRDPPRVHRPSINAIIQWLQQGLSPRSSAPGCSASNLAEHWRYRDMHPAGRSLTLRVTLLVAKAGRWGVGAWVCSHGMSPQH